MAEEKRLISVEEAAKYLGVQRSTMYSWAWRRKIPSDPLRSDSRFQVLRRRIRQDGPIISSNFARDLPEGHKLKKSPSTFRPPSRLKMTK